MKWLVRACLVCVVLAGAAPFSEAGQLVGAFVMPHGGIALDPTHFNTSNATARAEAWLLHKACQELAKMAASLQPDLILLSTPHGVAALHDFVLYLNPRGFGWADTDNCACPPCCYNVSVDIDSVGSLQLIRDFQKGAPLTNISGLSAFGPPAEENSDPFPLRWGEVIPLHFLSPGLPNTQLMILSQPSRRYNDSVEMIPELMKLGYDLQFYIQVVMEGRVLVVISADLAHTHLKSGPYGYSNTSEPFDQAIGKWARDLNSTALLVTAASLVDRALSCGFTGLVMLHAMMEAVGLQSWISTVYANYHPSYYGMMVASFLPKAGVTT